MADARQLARKTLHGCGSQASCVAVVEPVGRFLQPLRGERGRVLSLGYELAQQAVGMLVEALLAGVIGPGEEDAGVGHLGDLAVAAELLPVVADEVQDQCREGK